MSHRGRSRRARYHRHLGHVRAELETAPLDDGLEHVHRLAELDEPRVRDLAADVGARGRLGNRHRHHRLAELARGGGPDELLELVDREAHHRQVPRDRERQGPVRADREPLVLTRMIEELHIDDVARLHVILPGDRFRRGDRRGRDLAFRTARRPEDCESNGKGEERKAGHAVQPGPA